MKATKFFNVATILFTVATSFFCASCSDEEQKEQDRMPVYVQQQNKPIYTYVEIADNIADLYDLGVTYIYEDKTVVEDLNDKNEFVEKTRLNSRNEEVILKLKKYDFIQEDVANLRKVIVTATPKADAVAKVEAMPDNTLFDNHIFCFTGKKADMNSANQGETKGHVYGLLKNGAIIMLSRGKVDVATKTF